MSLQFYDTNILKQSIWISNLVNIIYLKLNISLKADEGIMFHIYTCG